MISDPLKYAEDFAKAGADIINFHVECDSPVEETIDKILSLGCKAGLTVKPKTPVEAVYPYLDKLSMVLIMTVEPGFGGQSFMYEAVENIKFAKMIVENTGRKIQIEVDGGINEETIQTVLDAGANVIVAGSAVFNGDIEANVKKLMEKF